MDKIRILLFDDQPIIRDGIRALLGAFDNFEIIGEAEAGETAVGKVLEFVPDVIVMDIAMPHTNYIEAVYRIKHSRPQTRILAMSRCDDNREHILSAIKAGIDGYIPKTATSSEFVSAINTLHREGSHLYPIAATILVQEYLNLPIEKPIDKLTGREKEIYKLVFNCFTSKEIARKLDISLKTVLVHRAKIMKKLGSRNLVGLVKYGIHGGMLQEN